MNIGRKPLSTPSPDPQALVVREDEFALGMAEMRSQGQSLSLAEQQEAMTGVFALGRMVGAAQMAETISVISATAKVRAFEEVNKSKSFKVLPIKHPNGDFCPAENIDAFCQVVFGKGYKAMNNDKVMLDRLGEDLYESAMRLGLHRAQLRLLINLPEDTRSVVDEAMRDGSKSDVVALIQSLANQLDEAKEKAAELKADVAAKEEILTRRAQQINELDEKLSRARKLPPDAVALELQAECTRSMNDSLGALRGRFAWSLRQLDAHEREHNPGNSLAFMAGVVGQVQAELDAIRDDLCIPDVLPALIPEWVTDPNFKNFAAN